ncbi:MAG: sugar phosphate nucleotidyltransferase, partial [Acidimicrobiia bacterium]|nr:sugar phosphate nucleotidyltransferase [Acidimicrobiia bacterium]
GPLIVANVDHLDEVESQIEDPALVVGEPVARNTAPAVAAAALLCSSEDVLVVLPADHHIADLEAFRQAVEVAVAAASKGFLVTFGIVPDRPESGYGYIVGGEECEGGRRIERFIEKPDPATAADLIARGARWNGGMFAFRAGVVIEELQAHAPRVLSAVRAAIVSGAKSGNRLRLGDEFGDSPEISLDVAVMERTDRGLVVSLDAGWSDAGSWESLYEMGDQDQAGNVITGDVVTVGAVNSYLRSEGPLVAAVGVDNLVVVATTDAVLIASRDRVQDVKALVEQLRDRPEALAPPGDQPTNR